MEAVKSEARVIMSITGNGFFLYFFHYFFFQISPESVDKMQENVRKSAPEGRRKKGRGCVQA